MHLSQTPLANLAQLTPLCVSNGDLQVQIPPSPTITIDLSKNYALEAI